MLEIIRELLEQSPMLALFAVIGLGYALGQISIAGFSLGVGAVLFAGLALGAIATKAVPPGLVSSIGLVMFLYGIGIQYGKQFFAGLSGPGLKWNVLAAIEAAGNRDAAALCKMADRGQIKGALLDGPLAFDNAISKAAAKTKGIASAVAGDADILLAPDLEAGNMLANQLIFLANADSAGLVLGARVPVVLISRADSVRARLASAGVAVRLAHALRTGSAKSS